MSNNPMVDAQLNLHEDKIAKIKNDIYLQGIGLKWCEEHITALEKKSRTEFLPEVSSLIAQNSHTEQLYKGMVREADEYRNRFRETNDQLERALRVISDKEETLDTAIKNVYKLSKENENLQKLAKDLTEGKKALEESRNEWRNALYYRDAEIKSLKETISNLKTEIKYSKTRYIDKTIEFNRLSKESLNLKGERDALTKELAKYCWNRVDTSNPLPFEDHDLYLFVIDGYSTPVKGRFHGDSLSHISIIVDDGKGKGPEHKIIFFMDGHIRYWMPLPKMPEGVDS